MESANFIIGDIYSAKMEFPDVDSSINLKDILFSIFRVSVVRLYLNEPKDEALLPPARQIKFVAHLQAVSGLNMSQPKKNPSPSSLLQPLPLDFSSNESFLGKTTIISNPLKSSKHTNKKPVKKVLEEAKY
jgi:hypothetical protein